MPVPQERVGTCYIQVKKGKWMGDLLVTKMTQQKPAQVDGDCVVVKVKVKTPPGFWDDPSVEVTLATQTSGVQATGDSLL